MSMLKKNGKGVLYRLDSVTGEKVVLDKELGDIDYEKGELKMYNVTIIKGSFFDNRISLRVKPFLMISRQSVRSILTLTLLIHRSLHIKGKVNACCKD